VTIQVGGKVTWIDRDSAYVCEIHPTMHGTVEVVEKG